MEHEVRLPAPCYEVQRGEVIRGIPLDDGTIHVGEEGRGRLLVRVPVPEGSAIQNGRLVKVPLSGEFAAAVVLIRDHSGFRGGWRLCEPWTLEEWERFVRRAQAHRPPDGNGPLANGHEDGECPACERVAPAPPQRRRASVRVIAEGFCAQGLAGRMGGGPEYLIVLPDGAAVEIVRWGRLYGKPSVLRLTADLSADTVTVTDPFAEALSRLAATRW